MGGSTISFPSMGAMPSSQNQQSEAAAGIETIKQLLGKRTALDQQLADIIPKAVTPQAGAGLSTPHLGSVPGVKDVPMLNDETYSHTASRNQGIANIVLAGASLVGKYVSHEKKQEHDQLATQIENVLKYTDGINQAQAILSQDPNNEDAKKVVEQNQKQLDAILADKKTRGKMAKAFDINFTDPTQNNTPEHAAGKQAIQSYSQQLQAKMPATMVPNQVAAAKATEIQAQSKVVDDQIKSLVPYVTAQIREEGAGQRQESRNVSAEQRTQEALQSKEATSIMHEEQENMRSRATNATRLKAAFGVAKMAQDGAMQRTLINAGMGYEKTINAVDMRLKAASGVTGTKQQQLLQQSYKMLDKTLTESGTQINNLENLRDKADSSQKDKYDKSIQFWEGIQEDYQNRLQSITKQLKESGGSLPGGDTSNNTGSSQTSSTSSENVTTSEQSTVAGTTDDSDNEDTKDDAATEQFIQSIINN
jgi:hypothetical protein